MLLNSTLVDVFYTHQYKLNEYNFKSRQVPLLVDDNLIIIIEFENIFENVCKSCEKQQLQQIPNKYKKDYESFLNKYKKLLELNENDLSKIIKSDQSNLIRQSIINCIGCRTSIEKFYKQIVKFINKTHNNKYSLAVDPFKIDSSGFITLKDDILNSSTDPYLLFSFFYINSSKYDDLIDQIVKFKKTSKRCNLHSLEYLSNQKSPNPLQYSFASTRRSVSPLPISSSTSSSSTSSLDQISSTDSLPFGSTIIKSDWLNVWNAFSNDQLRLKTLVIDTSKFLLTLDSYLRKHKFCNDCKLKVIKAFYLLVGESDPNKEKGYCPELYNGITYCSNVDDCFYNNNNNIDMKEKSNNQCDSAKLSKNSNNNKNQGSVSNKLKNSKNKHIHIKNDKKFISFLIAKAEPDLLGSRRERHAKTIDIAQEEVLTCIGIYLYERFYLIYQTIKSEEQTWILLFNSSMHALKKCLELEFEKMQGISNLELICAELEALDEKQEERKRIKKEKKKQKKLMNKLTDQKILSTSNDKENKISNSINKENNQYENQLIELNENISSQDTNDQQSIDLNNNSFDIPNDKIEKFIDKNDVNNEMDSITSLCRCNSSSFYSNLLSELNENNSQDDNIIMITEEEKNEYYANKSAYLIERINRRELLKQKFQNLKMNSCLKIRPRTFI